VSKAAKRERQRQNREAARAAQIRAAKRARILRTVRTVVIVAVVFGGVAFAWNLIQGDDSGGDKKATAQLGGIKRVIKANMDYTATIETSEGNIVASLDTEHAPIAVNNFVTLARKGFYDDLCVDRAAMDFMIQGGSPTCDQQGGPGYSVPGEAPTDNYAVGSLAAAKAPDEAAGTMGSQFFIVTGSQGATLPNDYARFGSVTSGLDVAQRIESFAPTEGDGKPTTDVTIIKITIDESARVASTTTSSAP